MLSVEARDCGRRLLRDDAAAVEFDRRLAPPIVMVKMLETPGRMLLPVSRLQDFVSAPLNELLLTMTSAKVVEDAGESERGPTMSWVSSISLEEGLRGR